jgi:MraZ protein
MPTFRGQYTNTLDDKGRVAIPAKFRKALDAAVGDVFVVTTGFDGCLFTFPRDVWERKEAQLLEQPFTNPRARKAVRLLLASAYETECDLQGRINLPHNLIEWARLQKEVLINGTLDHLELWDPQVYAAYMGDIRTSFEELAEDLIF